MSATTAHKPATERVLSAQEAAIASGTNVIHGTITDRVSRMHEAIRAYGPPRVTLDRAVLFTESFQETENQPLVLRWAKALKHFVEKAPVTIFPDELIVGRPNNWFGRWGIVYPELDGSVMPAGVEMFRKNEGKPGEVTVTEGDEKIISEVLTPYWAGKDYSTNYIRSLPEETRFMLYGPDPNNLIMMTLVVFASSPMRHSQNWTPDFSKILTRGVKGIREEAQAKLAALSAPRDIVYKKPFLDAVVMTCDAMTTWSRRYAQLARELAAKVPTLVAVHDAALVRRVERGGDLAEDVERDLRLEPGGAAQPLREVAALHPPHAQVRPPLVLAGLEDVDHVRVIERRQQAPLALEPRPERRIGRQRRRDQLQSDRALEQQVGGAVDDAHPARARLGLDPMAGELVSDAQLRAHGR